jgi:diacylglycerol kinase
MKTTNSETAFRSAAGFTVLIKILAVISKQEKLDYFIIFLSLFCLFSLILDIVELIFGIYRGNEN